MTRITNSLTRFLDRYLPEPFAIAIILTVFTALLAFIIEGAGPLSTVTEWGGGFWDLLEFTMQIAFILASGYVLANTPLAERLVNSLVARIQRPRTAVVVATLVGAIGSLINWGFGLIIGVLIARKLATKIRGVHFPLIISAAYSGFALYGSGLSGSVPLLIATPGHFMQDQMGIVPLSETIFSLPMLLMSLAIVVTLPVLNASLHPTREDEVIEFAPTGPEAEEDPRDSGAESLEADDKTATLADRISNSRILGMGISLIGFLYLAVYFINGNSLNINTVNFTILFLGLLLLGTPARYMEVLSDGVSIVAGIILQYPFYAGILAILAGSGLVVTFSGWFVDIATAGTLPLWSLFSAYLINIVAPSGGGQWAIQGPIMVTAAQEIGAPLAPTAMAVQLGDAWNNLIQPFWLLPVLAISGLKLKDIMGYTIVMMVWVGTIFIIGLSLWSFLG